MLTPEQVGLLTRVVQLLAIAMFGGTISAFIFHNWFNWPLIIIGFLASIGMIFVMYGVAKSDNPILIYTGMFIFGAAVAADLGGFFMLLGTQFELDPEDTTRAILITLGCGIFTTIVAGMIGLYSGINFQGLGYWLFAGLFVLIGLGVASLVGWISQRAEWFIGIAASVFWAVYMVFDFNKVVNLYNQNTWSAAVTIAMGLYLDFINFIIRIAPYIFQAIANKK